VRMTHEGSQGYETCISTGSSRAAGTAWDEGSLN
jgi:hypothetical protein